MDKQLAQRTFTQADQVQFASVSGDSNPMHMDSLQARRTQAGAPVVHGIHLLLWALDALAAFDPTLPPLQSLGVQFNKFVYLDEVAQVVLTRQTPAEARLSVMVGGAARSKISIGFGEGAGTFPAWANDVLDTIAAPRAALNLSMDQMTGRSGRLAFQMTSANAVALFPAASRWIGANRVAALAASTQLVGMVCPGLYSIYSGLSIECCDESESRDHLAFRVMTADPRFRAVEQEIAGGGLCGTIEGFARTPPVSQADMSSLKKLVDPAAFAGSVALVVGGSRGLGELTAKLIAAGGGRVIITWQRGKDDAERVAQEIRAEGGSCDTLPYDAAKPASEQLANLNEAPTHAYYFATPGIFRPQSDIYVPDRLKEFIAVYVEGFWDLAQALRGRQRELSLFYPSSVSVEDRPKGMTEYTMAKAAGEILCADMNASMAPLRVTVSRLPRLPTDQTASVTAAETENPVTVMLELVRKVQAARSQR